MLQITVKADPKKELYDPIENVFISLTKDETLILEHSLISLSKWESKWHVPFLDKTTPKTDEQTIDYIRCMTLNKNVDPAAYLLLSKENIEAINNYIEDPMTATWFNEEKTVKPGPLSHMKITNEIIYALMIQYRIPVEFEKWHLARLMTLIKVLNELNSDHSKPKKSRREFLSERDRINEERKAKYKTKG